MNTDEFTAKDIMYLAIALLAAMLAFGGCQMIEDHHERYSKETEQLYPKKP